MFAASHVYIFRGFIHFKRKTIQGHMKVSLCLKAIVHISANVDYYSWEKTNTSLLFLLIKHSTMTILKQTSNNINLLCFLQQLLLWQKKICNVGQQGNKKERIKNKWKNKCFTTGGTTASRVVDVRLPQNPLGFELIACVATSCSKEPHAEGAEG